MTARTPRDIEHVIALYDGEVAYADHRFGEFMDRLNAEGLSEGWVTVVTSDHGEQFLEHGNWVHGTNVHGELTRVPLIFAGPRDRVPSYSSIGGSIRSSITSRTSGLRAMRERFPSKKSCAGWTATAIARYFSTFTPPSRTLHTMRRRRSAIDSIRTTTGELQARTPTSAVDS